MPIPSPDDYLPLDGDALHTFIYERALNNIHGLFLSVTCIYSTYLSHVAVAFMVCTNVSEKLLKI